MEKCAHICHSAQEVVQEGQRPGQLQVCPPSELCWLGSPACLGIGEHWDSLGEEETAWGRRLHHGESGRETCTACAVDEEGGIIE